MHRLLLELLTQAGPQLLASAPSLLSQRKTQKRLLTSPEQREVERKSRQARKQVGVEQKVSGRERAKKKQGKDGGLKGFGVIS